jgi:hypothetical protein
MIVAKIVGGLGNQMFQYAFAKKLALQHKVELKLDISAFENSINPSKNDNRTFDLPIFNIKIQIASTEEIHKFSKSKFSKLLDYMCLNLPIKSNYFYLKEPYFHYFKNAVQAPSNTYVDGYWHSEKYFLNIKETLLTDFKLRTEFSADINTLIKEIKSVNSVSLHVRRGDYISNEANKKIYAQCNNNYYSVAIDYILRKIPNAKFYIFSDDIQWAIDNIKINGAKHFVNSNAEKKHFEDFFLMTNCKNNIIANSSFSWWAAWLNNNIEKIIIAPNKWYVDGVKNTKDLIPSQWITL